MQVFAVHGVENYDSKMKNRRDVLPALPGTGMVTGLLVLVLSGNVKGVIERMVVERLECLVPAPPKTLCFQGIQSLLVNLDRGVVYGKLL